jgi:antitoxin CcdA
VEYVTVSAKVRRELYEKLKMYRIPIGSVIKRALEEEVRKREEKEVRRKLAEAQAILKKIPEEEIVEAVRASREEK